MAETAFHLSSASLVLATIDDGFIRPAFNAASHQRATWIALPNSRSGTKISRLILPTNA